MKKLHLICNAHLDPVWQWEWEEGLTAAISTFTVAADICEQNGTFIFNHNEALLYKWVEDYAPILFARIKKLVAEGKWHIMGGWFLQPDCNMPSGESFVRQILIGREYFSKHFNAFPTTAFNVDSFGHSKGLVQILKKSGFTSYILMRPGSDVISLPYIFNWIGYDGSLIKVCRIDHSYSSGSGAAVQTIKNYIESHENLDIGLRLWGIGDHGGGPSKHDVDAINKYISECKDVEITHSRPEAFFEEYCENSKEELQFFNKPLNPQFVGCYTSQSMIKARHRKIENECYLAEKMVSNLALHGLMVYPKNKFDEALFDLCLSEFHDVITGTSTKLAEVASLKGMDHGLEIISRIKAKAFIKLIEFQEKPIDGNIPVFIYNPHPYEVEGIFDCEFMLADMNFDKKKTHFNVYYDSVLIKSQIEKENSTINLDWRKKIVFKATLKPSQMNRFECIPYNEDKGMIPEMSLSEGCYVFENKTMKAVFSDVTGQLIEYGVDGDILVNCNVSISVFDDDADPWKFNGNSFNEKIGEFVLAENSRALEISGCYENNNSFRIIEDGPIRTVVESILTYKSSHAVIHYSLPKEGNEIHFKIKICNNEKHKMIKLLVPTNIKNSHYSADVAYGIEHYETDGRENPMQKWILYSNQYNAVTLVNDCIYGCSVNDGIIHQSLIRAAVYCAHPLPGRTLLPVDRCMPCIDQGEREFDFWLNGGNKKERIENISHEAQCHNEKPMCLNAYPYKEETIPIKGIELSKNIRLVAFKQAEDGNGFIIRLFEPLGQINKGYIKFDFLGLKKIVEFTPFEIKTFRLYENDFVECDLIERKI